MRLFAFAHIFLAVFAGLPAFGEGADGHVPLTSNQRIIQINAKLSALNKGAKLDAGQAALLAQEAEGVRNEIQYSLNQGALNPREVGQLLSTFRPYFNLVRNITQAQLQTQAPTNWDVPALRAQFAISVPATLGANWFMNTPRLAEVVAVPTATEVRYSLSPSLITGIGLRHLLQHLTKANYEAVVRCTLGVTYANHFAEAFAASGEGTNSNLEARLANLAAKPFCMKQTFSAFIREKVNADMLDAQMKVARVAALSAIPDAGALLPPQLLNSLAKSFRHDGELLKLADNWGLLLTSAEKLEDRKADDSAEVISLTEARQLASQFAGFDTSFLGQSESSLVVFDEQLYKDVTAFAAGLVKTNRRTQRAFPLNRQEVERRLRLGQVSTLKSSLTQTLSALSYYPQIEGPYLHSQLAVALGHANNIALSTAIINVLTAASVPLEPSHQAVINAMAERAHERHFARIAKSSDYTIFLNRWVTSVKRSATAQGISRAAAQGVAATLRTAAKEIHELVGPQVPDEKLPYMAQFVLGMLEGEIKSSSPRVEQWFEFIKHSGNYQDYVRSQTQVEAHIKQAVSNVKFCEVHPLSLLDRASMGFQAITKAFFAGAPGRKANAVNQNDVDCERFIRLSLYANIRNTEEVPKDMSGVVKAIDTYRNEEFRKTLTDVYRKLLKIDILDKNRILDLIVDEGKRELNEILAVADGTEDIFKAINKTLENVHENMLELVNASNLDALAPIITRTSLLDAALQGKVPLLRGQIPSTDSVTSVATIRELINNHKIKTFTDLKKEVSEESDYFISASRFHTQIKDQYKILTDAKNGQWNYFYQSSLQSIFAIIPIVMTRRLLTYAPKFWLSNALNDYMTYNASLGRGYFSFLTLVFASDAAYQHFVALPELGRLRRLDDRYAHSALLDGALLSPFKQLNSERELNVLEEDARSRRFWGAVLTAVPPLLAPTLKLAQRGFRGVSERYAYNLERQWQTESKIEEDALAAGSTRIAGEPFKIERMRYSLKVGVARRLERIGRYNRIDLRILKLNPDDLMRTVGGDGPAVPLMTLESLKKAFKAFAKDGEVTDIAAINSYRRLLRALYDDASSYMHSSNYMKGIYSQAYAGKDKLTYFDDLQREFERVVLGL